MPATVALFDMPNLPERIENELVDLPYPALERLVVLLMRSMAYREVRVVDGGKQRGRSNFGGMSIMARSRGTLRDGLTLIQVKQIAVQRRNVDELRGAMDAWGASHGIIFTTSSIPEAARLRADLCPGKPIHLVSRRKFAKLLIARNLGVRTAPLPVGFSDKLIVDSLFFEMLTESRP
jgi:restriction endonuclease Mrr